MCRLVRVLVLINVAVLVHSWQHRDAWRSYVDYVEDIMDYEQSREENTMDVFNDLANSLISAEDDIRRYCNQNEKVVEMLNSTEYQCTYSFGDYDESSVIIKIRHRVMRVMATSKVGLKRKILDNVRILPDRLVTKDAWYNVQSGKLTIYIPADGTSHVCKGAFRGARRGTNRLLRLLVTATLLVDSIAFEMYMPEELRWQKTLLGHTFTMSRGSCIGECESSTKAVVTAFRSWLQAHEEAQVMFASVLVVVGLWWLVRTMLALLINLVCPILVVILAVVCVPQLRAPLLGQNYPLLANLIRNILLKLAETLNT